MWSMLKGVCCGCCCRRLRQAVTTPSWPSSMLGRTDGLKDTYAPATLSVRSRALFQFSKRAAGEATKFGRSGVKLLGVVGAARLECDEPAAESGELIRRQLGNSFGDFFDFHGAPTLSTAWTGDAGSGVASRLGHPSGRSP